MSDINWQERAEAAEARIELAIARATHEQLRANEVAAENVALRNVFGPGDAVFNFLAIALRHTIYDEIDLSDVTLAFQMSLPETPATEAWCREMRALGVEAFARHCQNRHAEMMATEPNHPVSNEAISAIRRAGEFALYFAHQLRAGAEK